MKFKLFPKIFTSFSTTKPIFLKATPQKSEQQICQKISQFSLQSPRVLFLNSLGVLQKHCVFMNHKTSSATERDYEQIQKGVISSMKYELETNVKCENFEDINEKLRFLTKLIMDLPLKLWEKCPLLSSLFKDLLAKNLINICDNFSKIFNTDVFSFPQQNAMGQMIAILRILLEKEIFIDNYLDFCNKNLLSQEKSLLMPPDVVLNIKTAILSLIHQKKDFQKLFSIITENKDFILKNSKILSILETDEILRKMEKNSDFIKDSLSFIENNMKFMDFLEIEKYLDFLLSYESNYDNFLISIRNELNIRLISNNFTSKEMKALINLLQRHKNNKNTKMFEVILNKNFQENEHFLTPENIRSLFQAKNIEKIDKNFIDFLQKKYFPNLLKLEDNFSWIFTILAIIFQGKLLNTQLLLSIENQLIENKEKTLKILDLYNFQLLLYLLAENGFTESPLFEFFEEFFLTCYEPSPQEKNLKVYIHIFQITVNSTRPFSKDYFQKLFSIFMNNFIYIVEKANIREISTFLRAFAVFDVSFQGEEYKKMTDSLLFLIKSTNLMEKIEIKESKIEGSLFKMILNHNNCDLFLDDFFKIYQFLFTFQKRFSSDKIFKMYDSIVEKTNFHTFLRVFNSSLHVDIMEILKRMRISFVTEKQIKIYIVDIFVEPNIVIEALGNKHFSRGKKLAKPKDLLKATHLKQLGYCLVEIPYFEFMEKFFTDFEGRRKYVWDKIKDHLPEEEKKKVLLNEKKK